MQWEQSLDFLEKRHSENCYTRDSSLPAFSEVTGVAVCRSSRSKSKRTNSINAVVSGLTNRVLRAKCASQRCLAMAQDLPAEQPDQRRQLRPTGLIYYAPLAPQSSGIKCIPAPWATMSLFVSKSSFLNIDLWVRPFAANVLVRENLQRARAFTQKLLATACKRSQVHSQVV